MPLRPSLAPDFDLATAYPEVARLRAALAAGDWAGVREEFAGVDAAGASLLARAVGETEPAYEFLNTVVAGDPADSLAATLLASWLVRAGWPAPTRRARVTRPDRRAASQDHLHRAEQLLADVTDRDPGNLVAWELRLVTARGLELGLDEARARYRRAAGHAAHHLPLQAQMLQQLCPQWGGSWRDAHAFAREYVAAAPAGTPNGVLVAVAHLEQWRELGGRAGRRYLADPRVRRELRDAAARSVWYPRYRRRYGWVGVHNVFAMAFSLAGDVPAAASQFAAVGNLADPFPWEYLGDPAAAFHKHRARSRRVPVPEPGGVPADPVAARRPGAGSAAALGAVGAAAPLFLLCGLLGTLGGLRGEVPYGPGEWLVLALVWIIGVALLVGAIDLLRRRLRRRPLTGPGDG